MSGQPSLFELAQHTRRHTKTLFLAVFHHRHRVEIVFKLPLRPVFGVGHIITSV